MPRRLTFVRRALWLSGALAVVTTSVGAQGASGPVALRAFADINYIGSERPGAQGFREGQLAVHANAALSDRLAFFGEVTASPQQTTAFSVEVERAYVRYDVGDWLKISAGRFHTPVGFWNTAYHHGTWLQTPVGRPEIIRGGSGFVPLHLVGALVEGSRGTGPLTVRYLAGVGNGRGATPNRPGDAGDVNLSRAWTIGGSVSPATLPSLRVGASYYRDVVATTLAPVVQLDEHLASAYLAWDAKDHELIAEYVHGRHATRLAPSVSHASEGFYGQAAHRLPGPFRAFKPYARAERVRPHASDPFYAPLRLRYDGVLLGIRADIAHTAAFKVEHRHERFDQPRWYRAIVAQLSFTFPGFAHDHDTIAARPPHEGSGDDH